MPNANTFPDGGRGRVVPGDLGRVAEYAASTLPTRGPGMLGRRFPQGTTGFPLSARARAAATAITYPFQPSKSKWQGTGADPHASDRVGRFRLRRGKICGRTSVNPSDEFVCFGDLTDTEIEEDDAVVTQVYAEVPVTETTTGDGNILYGRSTIKIIEGDDLQDALGDDAFTVPTDGTLPAKVIVPICEVQWWGGAMHFPPGTQSYLWLACVITGTQCGSATRLFRPYGYASDPDYSSSL